jgi:DNA-binding NtrC family response regulator
VIKILIVDDCIFTLSMYKIIFEKLNNKINFTYCNTFKDAKKICHENWDGAFLDWSLNNKHTSMELIPLLHHVKHISIISGNKIEDIEKKLKKNKERVEKIINKPFHAAEILKLVNNIIKI